ncbi:hypothetical protein [Natronospira sp.]|uniref:hypothetical protein n=1 Tax=Natronospira sp. TaxID=2024970 RepID=UPI0038735A2E
MGYANLKVTDFDGVQQLIHEAMKKARPDSGYFEHTSKGGRRSPGELEDAFQKALVEGLEDLTQGGGWQWWREQPLRTDALTNRQRIDVDIVGKDKDGDAVAIELKYVTLARNKDKEVFEPPNDAPAFPYDVVKDALKVELLLRHEAGLEAENAKPVYGVSIALTNDSRFWGGSKEPPQGWSREFGSAFVKAGTLPRVLKTNGRNPDNCIFKQKRCHISLGLDWNLSWHDFSVVHDLPGHAAKFRYALLAPDTACQKDGGWEIQYRHDKSESAYIPFLSNETRKRFFVKHDEMWAK